MEERISSEAVLQATYDELRRLARRRLAVERADHTLQATALVHEVYCRLRKQGEDAGWTGRDHFLAAASEAMRRILVEHARHKLAIKRGGKLSRRSLDSLAIELPMPAEELLDVHAALDLLAGEQPTVAELVKLRVFGGLSHIEAADHLGISRGRADRMWSYAKARLFLYMDGKATKSDPNRPIGGCY